MSKVTNIAMQTARVLVDTAISESKFQSLSERWDMPGIVSILDAGEFKQSGWEIVNAAVDEGLLFKSKTTIQGSRNGKRYYGGHRYSTTPFEAPSKGSTSSGSLDALKAAMAVARGR